MGEGAGLLRFLMKKIILLFTLCIFSIYIKAQDFIINPKSKSPEKSTVVIKSFDINGAISPEQFIENGSIIYTFFYEITDDYGNKIYSKIIKSTVENIPDYFFTEQTVFHTKVPEFRWSGEGIENLERGKYNFTLTISLIEKNDKTDNELSVENIDESNISLLKDSFGRNVMASQVYTILVDTEGPYFEVDYADIPSQNIETETNSILLYTTEESDSAVAWEIQEINTGFCKQYFYKTPHVMPVTHLLVNGISGTCNLIVKAWDSVENCREQKISIALKKTDPKLKEKFYAMQSLENVLDAFKEKFSAYKIQLEENFSDNVVVQQKNLSSNFVKELVFKSKDKTVCIPTENLNKNISWKFNKDDLPVGDYSAFVRLFVSEKLYDFEVGSLSVKNDNENSPAKVLLALESNREVDLKMLKNKETSLLTGSFVYLQDTDLNPELKIEICDSKGNLIKNINNEDIKEQDDQYKFCWYGENENNEIAVQAGEQFFCVLFSEGKILEKKEFSLGMIYENEDGKSKICIPDLIFPPNQNGFFGEEDLFLVNYKILKDIASVIKNNADSIQTVLIAGYANPTAYPKKDAMIEEDTESLIPLSLQRATAVKNVLVVLGVPENILEVVGKGGLEYVANPLDSNENYKNRRIQFFIR